MAVAPCIAILTDFGYEDAYVGIMKGVIAGISPGTTVIDLTHAVPPQDVREGAWQLLSAYRYFREGTIFLCVVDPGVGTKRRPLVFQSGSYVFVGPDNGLMSWAVNAAAGEGGVRGRIIERPDYRLPEVSATFHGRDVFAPVAAHLAGGADIKELGPEIEDWQQLEFPQADTTHTNMIVGTILHIDRFGNLITNIPRAEIQALESALPGKRTSVRFHAAHVEGVSDTYADAKSGSLVALYGSTGYLELAVNGGNAAQRFRAHLGEQVTVSRE